MIVTWVTMTTHLIAVCVCVCAFSYTCVRCTCMYIKVVELMIMSGMKDILMNVINQVQNNASDGLALWLWF